MESLTEEGINIAHAQKKVNGYVTGELTTFFQNSKLMCPVL
jgi:hypothetical protein